MAHPKVQSLIEHFNLRPLPVEKALFNTTYVSREQIADDQPMSNAIIALYADEPYSVSLFHRLPVDEIWHFYAGDPFRLVLLYPDGSSRDVIMGSNPLDGHRVQFVILAGTWQAGHMLAGGTYSLFGCTLAPAFTDSMFEGGTYEGLIDRYPDRADDLRLLGCEPDATSMV